MSNQLISLILPGLITGAIYSIMASGLVLTYQTSGVFNFSHAGIAFVTAYVYYQLHTGIGLPVLPAFAIAVLIFAPALGWALDRVVLRHLRTAPMHARIVATIGLLVALPNLAQWLVEVVMVRWWGIGRLIDVSSQSSLGPLVPAGVGPTPPDVVDFGFVGLPNVTLTSDQLFVFAAAIISGLVLYLVLKKTRVGLEMRAVVDREPLAAARAIEPGRTSGLAWMLSSALAGLGGVLIAPLFQLDSTSFQFVVLGSLAAVALAGFRSLPLAFFGGLALGVVQNLIAGYRDTLLPSVLSQLGGLATALPFILMLVILLVRAGGRTRAAGTVSDERPSVDHREGLPTWRRRLPWAIGIALLIIYTFGWIPFFSADLYSVNTYIAPGVAYAIIYLSFVVVTGLGGMISLAQATFVTAGGMATGYLLQRDLGLHVPILGTDGGQPSFLVACLLGAGVAALLGALIAAAVRKLGPLALALGTLAFAFTLDFVVFRIEAVSNHNQGWSIPGPSWKVFGHTFAFDVYGDHGRQLVLLLLFFFGVISLLIHNLERSASGRSIFAIRSSEVAARTSGVAVWRPQVALFALSAGIAGFGGSWLGVTSFSVGPNLAPPVVGLFWLSTVVLMGVRRPGGALLAGLFTTCAVWIFGVIGDHLSGAASDVLTSPYFTQMLIGLGAVQLAANPDGLLALVGHRRLQSRRRRERLGHLAAAEREIGEPDAPHSSVDVAQVLRLAGCSESADGAPPVLLLQDVVAGYGDAKVLHGINLAVGRGQIVALLGPNGAGKSTLCLTAAGALRTTAGRIILNDSDMTDLSAPERARRGIVLVPEARGVFPGLTVDDNIQILLRDRAGREALYDNFPTLARRRNQLAGVLSGGEQQLLSLAPVIQKPPALLIADEPTLGLSPQVSTSILEALVAVRATGTSVLLVEERASEVMKIADVVGVMDLGRLTWAGQASDVADEQLTAAYLS